MIEDDIEAGTDALLNIRVKEYSKAGKQQRCAMILSMKTGIR